MRETDTRVLSSHRCFVAITRGVHWASSTRERLMRPHLNACGLAIGTSSVATPGAPCGCDGYTGLSAVTLLWSDWISMSKGVKQATHTMPNVDVFFLGLRRYKRPWAGSNLI